MASSDISDVTHGMTKTRESSIQHSDPIFAVKYAGTLRTLEIGQNEVGQERFRDIVRTF